MPPMTAMMSTLIAAPTPMVPGEMRPLNQTSSTPARPGDQPGVGGGLVDDPVPGDVEADRPHPARVVADRLQREAEGRALAAIEHRRADGDHRDAEGRDSRTGIGSRQETPRNSGKRECR